MCNLNPTDYIGNNLAKILMDDKYDVRNSIVSVGNIDIIPSGEDLEDAERYIEAKGGNVNHRLSNRLKGLINSGYYDFCIADSKPVMSTISRNIMCFVDYILLICQSQFVSLNDTQTFIKTFYEVNRELEEIGLPPKNILGCLITMTDNTSLSKNMIDNIKDAMTQQGIKTFETNIRKNTKIAESPIQNLPVSLYAPKSNGGMDYHN